MGIIRKIMLGFLIKKRLIKNRVTKSLFFVLQRRIWVATLLDKALFLC